MLMHSFTQVGGPLEGTVIDIVLGDDARTRYLARVLRVDSTSSMGGSGSLAAALVADGK